MWCISSIIKWSFTWCIRSIIKWYFNNTIRNLQRNSTIFKSTLNITSTHSDHSSKKYTTHSNLLSQSKSITNKLKSHHHSRLETEYKISMISININTYYLENIQQITGLINSNNRRK